MLTKSKTVLSYLARKKRARFKRCILHIGTEKTGTSTIQRFLVSNRDALAAEGVLYPTCGGGESGGSQWGFAASVCRAAWKLDLGRFLNIRSAEDQAGYRAALINSLGWEFEALAEREILVISSEHFQSRLRHIDEIAALKDFLAHWVVEFQVVLYLRRQDRVAMSLYSTKVKSGNPKPGVFDAIKAGPLPYYFDYEAIYRQWAEVFGAGAVAVRLFDRAEWAHGDLVQDFAAAGGIVLAGKEIPESENESLSQEGVDFLLEVNKQLPHTAKGGSDALRQKIAHRVSLLCKGRPTGVSRAQAQAFYGHFLESNERLRKAAFPDRDRPLFDECFDDYPEQATKTEPRYEDAVRMAIRLMETL
ncbi:hypothetical protein [Nitrococcus mobilis]|uniref:Sulfotransferase domain-containing protein n=1 Tax=Nitrococcus mobilis Nb-231 TaxID=314278 RepID=A4BRR9_9GAMM|nr:hypothetical protein [Nitrococcus mobilis]EAR21640.1 hypothetical protein NB231_02698 [Nitrococcus mobilis Nb-231]